MLDDTPRKLLRIIFQFQYHFRRMLGIKELARLSSRRPADIYKFFKDLAVENYIQWSMAESIDKVIIKGIYHTLYRRSGAYRAARNYWLYHYGGVTVSKLDGNDRWQNKMMLTDHVEKYDEL